MASMVVKGVGQWDGTYDLDDQRAFNTREWRVIREVSGYLPLTAQDGFAKKDPTLFVALTVIAMCRTGKIQRERALEVAEQLAEAPFDGVSIAMVGDAVEDAEEVPLDLTSEPAEPSLTGSL